MILIDWVMIFLFFKEFKHEYNLIQLCFNCKIRNILKFGVFPVIYSHTTLLILDLLKQALIRACNISVSRVRSIHPFVKAAGCADL